MPVKEDLRVKRTKKALFDAFLDLLTQKSFDAITINELCDVAGIRRATFYKHYSDKLDFLAAYTVLLRDKFDRNVWRESNSALTPEYYVEYAKSLIRFIDDNSVAIRNLCKCTLFPTVFALITEQNFKDTCDRLRISVAQGMKLPASVEVTASMCTGGVSSCIRGLVSGEVTDANDLAEQIGNVVAEILGCNKN